MMKKNYCVNSNNTNLKAIAELVDRSNQKDEKSFLYNHFNDSLRIKQMEKNDNEHTAYSQEQTEDETNKFIDEYNKLGTSALYDIVLSTKQKLNISTSNKNVQYKEVLSVFSQKNKKKRHHVLKINTKYQLSVIPKSITIKPESGELSNGDLEKRNTLEESYAKNKSHIGKFSLYYKESDKMYTPTNAYYNNDPNYTKFLPYYNCTDKNPISGKYSVQIRNKKGVGYVLFYQKFFNGSYQYSFLTRGNKGTKVCILYDTCRNSKWQPNNLAILTLPDKRIFSINVSFDIDTLSGEDYFVVGAWVSDGEAYLDNFSVSQIPRLPSP